MPKKIPCEHNPVSLCADCKKVRAGQSKRDYQARLRKTQPAKLRKRKRAWYLKNKERVSLYNKERHEANKESRQAYFRKRYAENPKYRERAWDKAGIVWAEGQTFEAVCKQQDQLCAGGCGRDLLELNSKQVHVDHDKTVTGRPNIRGVLCHRCNMGAGLLGDNAEQVRRMLQYLENPLFRRSETPQPVRGRLSI